MGILDDKVAIVTGSARGIGRAVAELLAEHGARVLINDLDADLAEEAAGEIDGETTVFGGDLTKPGVCDGLVQAAVDAWGRIDIIVNNAGYTIDAPAHKLTDDGWQRMLDIHVTVPFRVCRAAAPHLREPAKREREEGREVFRKIVNVSSTSGVFGNAGREGVGAVQDQRQRGRVRVRGDAPDGLQGGVEHDGDRRPDGPARDPGSAARDGRDADPARPAGVDA
jgi:3-oxoacyl-[acyl-carrier protein] reductase